MLTQPWYLRYLRNWNFILGPILSLVFLSASSWSRGEHGVIVCAETLSDFNQANPPKSGIGVTSVSDWYTEAEVSRLSDGFPVPVEGLGRKFILFSSEARGVGEVPSPHPSHARYYREQPKISEISAKMRLALIQTVPPLYRPIWRRKPYKVYALMSQGNSPVQFDHRMHFHRDRLTASLTLSGAGSKVKVVKHDTSEMLYDDIYHLADFLPGVVYAAKSGELVTINGVHFKGGGLYAEPEKEDKIPPRFSLFVVIDQNPL